jgi:hypothetical protein
VGGLALSAGFAGADTGSGTAGEPYQQQDSNARRYRVTVANLTDWQPHARGGRRSQGQRRGVLRRRRGERTDEGDRRERQPPAARRTHPEHGRHQGVGGRNRSPAQTLTGENREGVEGRATSHPDLAEGGAVTPHPGITGVGDLPEKFDWDEPAASVVVERIA